MLGQFAVIYIVLLAAVKGEEECEGVQDIQRCLETSVNVPFVNIPDLPDEEFLKENCGPAIHLIECAIGAVQKCPEAVTEYISDTMDSLQLGFNFLHAVCDEDSELKKRYLENVGCYSTKNPQIRECRNITDTLAFDFLEKEEDFIKEAGYTHGLCLSMPKFNLCVVKEMTEVCGEEGTSPLDEILTQLATVNIVLACPDESRLARWQERFDLYLEERAPDLVK